jgi:hypothetical protein
MKNSNQRLQFLSSYRAHLRHELDQMKYDQTSQTATKEISDAPDRVSGFIAIAAMMLVFASVFLV